MTGQGNGSEHRYVTNAELAQQLREKPGRWEVRFLVILGFFGAQVVPGAELAQAAIQHVF